VTFPTAQWCRSRRGRALCTRPVGHAGLHNRLGTSQMWSDVEADPPACAGAGMPGVAARSLPNGFPHGRALCPVCDAFVELVPPARSGAAVLADHDVFTQEADAAAAEQRAAWFNTFGWD